MDDRTKTTNDQTGWISRPKAASILGCDSKAIDRMLGAGVLPCRRLPGCQPRLPLTAVLLLRDRSTVGQVALEDGRRDRDEETRDDPPGGTEGHP